MYTWLLYLRWSSSAPTSLYKIYWPLFQRPLSHFFLLFMWLHLYLPYSSYSDCLCPVTWGIFPGHNHSPPTQVYIIWLIYLPKLRSYSSHFLSDSGAVEISCVVWCHSSLPAYPSMPPQFPIFSLSLSSEQCTSLSLSGRALFCHSSGKKASLPHNTLLY